MEYVENKVLELRKQKNVTQEEFADEVGVSRQTVVAIEKGNYTPSLLLGLKIAKFFKKGVDEIFKYKYEK
jgi:putative transcriptional regulator